MKVFSIGSFKLGEFAKPYIIAEIGVNHEGEMSTAKKLIEQAAKSGAHAAKFQTYKAESLAIKNSPAYWDQSKEPTKSQYGLFKKYDSFGESEYNELYNYCQKLGIDFLSTPFDLGAVDFLSPMVPAFKIASADITNVPLIRKCASKKKPLVISTGASTLSEIEFAIQTAQRSGATDIALLHCVLNYPTPEDCAQLNKILDLKRLFPLVSVGYSDHVVPDYSMSALEVATLLGATILEKHFTHDKNLQGNDHYHAMNEADLRVFCKKLETYRRLLQVGNDVFVSEAQARLHARRSITSSVAIKKGEYITTDNITTKRPAHGISPIHWDEVIGKKAICDIDEDTPLQFYMLGI